MKRSYGYRAERISRAIDELTGGNEAMRRAAILLLAAALSACLLVGANAAIAPAWETAELELETLAGARGGLGAAAVFEGAVRRYSRHRQRPEP